MIGHRQRIAVFVVAAFAVALVGCSDDYSYQGGREYVDSRYPNRDQVTVTFLEACTMRSEGGTPKLDGYSDDDAWLDGCLDRATELGVLNGVPGVTIEGR